MTCVDSTVLSDITLWVSSVIFWTMMNLLFAYHFSDPVFLFLWVLVLRFMTDVMTHWCDSTFVLYLLFSGCRHVLTRPYYSSASRVVCFCIGHSLRLLFSIKNKWKCFPVIFMTFMIHWIVSCFFPSHCSRWSCCYFWDVTWTHCKMHRHIQIVRSLQLLNVTRPLLLTKWRGFLQQQGLI
jgi:hypothetical protein